MARLFHLLGLCLAAVLAVGCDKIPLFAPSQSTITLTAGQRVLPLNASVEVTAVVVEPSGTPVQNGTAVRFSTTLGRMDPVEVETRNGVAASTFHAGNVSGVADVRAISGGVGGTSSTAGNATTATTATNIVTFLIGAAAADTVTIRTNPSSVLASGGTVEVSAIVLDASGQGISGIPVSFSANHGTLTDTVAISNANGVATVGLTTNVETSVSATAGSKSTATAAVVTVRGTPSITIACQGNGSAGTSCSQTVGQPVAFTVSKATGSTSLVSAVLSFGDGTSATLGTLSSAVTVTHTYASPNAYTATVTATDVNGQSTSASVAVAAVQSTPLITVTCQGSTLTSCSQTVGQPVTFTIRKATGSSTLVSAVLVFGDGGTSALGTLSSEVTVSHTYSSVNAYTARVTATDTNGQTTTSSVAVNVIARAPLTVTFSAADTTAGSLRASFAVTVAAVGEQNILVESVTWNFGDGSGDVPTSGTSTARVYAATGSYVVTATVRTQDGRSGTARTEIQIRP